MRFGLLLAVLIVAVMLLLANVAYADGGNGAVIDISLTAPKADVGAICEVNARTEGSSEINTVTILSPYAGDGTGKSNHATIQVTNDAVVDVTIRDDLRVDIAASGPCELNVRVDGPWEVHIDADDEVELNVEASDESQVFVDDRSLDNPAQKPDEPAGYQESGDLDDSSRFNGYLPVISGAFPAAGLFAFFLIRRRAKRAESQPKGGRNEVV